MLSVIGNGHLQQLFLCVRYATIPCMTFDLVGVGEVQLLLYREEVNVSLSVA